MNLEIILVVVLTILLVALFAMSYFKRRKFNTEMSQMREDIKVGDKVMTDSGVVGEVVETYSEEEYKYFVLKSGKGDNTGYFTVHANAVYYVFGKEDTRTDKKTTIVMSSESEK